MQLHQIVTELAALKKNLENLRQLTITLAERLKQLKASLQPSADK